MQVKHLGATADEAVGGTRPIGQAVWPLGECPLQPRAAVAVKHGGQHGQRQGFIVGGTGGCGRVERLQARHLEGERHNGLFGRGFEVDTAQAHLLRLDLRFAGRHCAGRNGAKVLFGQPFDLCRVHVPRHHHSGVAGHVPAFVEVTCVLRGVGSDVAHPANHRAAVG